MKLKNREIVTIATLRPEESFVYFPSDFSGIFPDTFHVLRDTDKVSVAEVAQNQVVIIDYEWFVRKSFSCFLMSGRDIEEYYLSTSVWGYFLNFLRSIQLNYDIPFSWVFMMRKSGVFTDPDFTQYFTNPIHDAALFHKRMNSYLPFLSAIAAELDDVYFCFRNEEEDYDTALANAVSQLSEHNFVTVLSDFEHHVQIAEWNASLAERVSGGRFDYLTEDDLYAKHNVTPYSYAIWRSLYGYPEFGISKVLKNRNKKQVADIANAIALNGLYETFQDLERKGEPEASSILRSIESIRDSIERIKLIGKDQKPSSVRFVRPSPYINTDKCLELSGLNVSFNLTKQILADSRRSN